MNILFVINTIEPGGAEMFVLRFAKALIKQKHQIYILPLHPEKSNVTFLSLFLTAQITVLNPYIQPSKKKEILYWKLNALYSMFGRNGVYVKLRSTNKKTHYKKLLKKYKIQLINSHLLESDNFAVNYLKKIFQLPVIVTMHSSYNKVNVAGSPNTKKFIELSYSIFNKANFVTYLTEENKYIFSLFNEPVNTPLKKIYLGYERPLEIGEVKHKIKEKEITFGMIGRGIIEKGWEITIHAFEKLQEEFSNIQLIIIAPKTEYIEFLENKYSKNKKILFTGYIQNPEAYIQLFDVALLPSYSESLPVSIIEELTFGVPVIASNVGEIKEMITDTTGELAGSVIPIEKNGIPSPEKLLSLMRLYMTESLLLPEHKKRALSASKKFSMDRCIDEYLKIYRLAIKR